VPAHITQSGLSPHRRTAVSDTLPTGAPGGTTSGSLPATMAPSSVVGSQIHSGQQSERTSKPVLRALCQSEVKGGEEEGSSWEATNSAW
jgi:hypothetical protein